MLVAAGSKPAGDFVALSYNRSSPPPSGSLSKTMPKELGSTPAGNFVASSYSAPCKGSPPVENPSTSTAEICLNSKTSARFAPRRSAPCSLAKRKLDQPKSTPRKSAPRRSDHQKNACAICSRQSKHRKDAPRRSAARRSAETRPVFDRSAFTRTALRKSTWRSFALWRRASVRSAPRRSAFQKFAPTSTASLRSAQASCAFSKSPSTWSSPRMVRTLLRTAGSSQMSGTSSSPLPVEACHIPTAEPSSCADSFSALEAPAPTPRGLVATRIRSPWVGGAARGAAGTWPLTSGSAS